MDIQLAHPDDAEEIAELSRTEIEHGLPWSWRRARILREIRHPSTNVAVARHLGRLAGFGIMHYRDDEVAHLALLAVHPAYRRRGLATQLLSWLEKVALTGGISEFHVEVRADNLAGQALYRQAGYVEARVVALMYSGRIDGLRLEKRVGG